MGLYSGFAGEPRLSCARCHTAGWSLSIDAMHPRCARSEGVAGCGGGNPSGIGFNLCGGSVKDRFPDDTWKRARRQRGYRPGDWTTIRASTSKRADGSKVRLDGNGNTGRRRRRAVSGLHRREHGRRRRGDTRRPNSTVTLRRAQYVSQLWQPDSEDWPTPSPPTPNWRSTRRSGDFVNSRPQLAGIEDVPGDVIRAEPIGRLVGDCTVFDYAGTNEPGSLQLHLQRS